MKFIKKVDCTIKHGYPVCGSEVIALPFAVFNELAKLSYQVQAAQYNKENRPEMPKPVEPFKPLRSYTDFNVPEVEVDTPALDKAIKEAMALADDIETSSHAGKVNKLLADDYKNLALFVDEDEFLACDGFAMERLPIDPDWNIFEWAQEDLLNFLNLIAEFGGKPFNKED